MAQKSEPSEGLLKGILAQTGMERLGITPQLTQQEIVVELSTAQLRDMLLANADERAKRCVTLEIHEGKLVLKIRLW